MAHWCMSRWQHTILVGRWRRRVSSSSIVGVRSGRSGTRALAFMVEVLCVVTPPPLSDAVASAAVVNEDAKVVAPLVLLVQIMVVVVKVTSSNWQCSWHRLPYPRVLVSLFQRMINGSYPNGLGVRDRTVHGHNRHWLMCDLPCCGRCSRQNFIEHFVSW